MQYAMKKHKTYQFDIGYSCIIIDNYRKTYYAFYIVKKDFII